MSTRPPQPHASTPAARAGWPARAPARRGGFTLVELLAAVALTGLLAAALLTIVAGLGRQVTPARTGDALHTAEATGLKHLLERDLLQARAVTLTADSLTLHTLSHLHADTLDASHRPVRVRYHHLEDDGALVREQYDPLDTTGQPRSAHLVATGVSSLHVARADDEDNDSITLTITFESDVRWEVTYP